MGRSPGCFSRTLDEISDWTVDEERDGSYLLVVGARTWSVESSCITIRHCWWEYGGLWKIDGTKGGKPRDVVLVLVR